MLNVALGMAASMGGGAICVDGGRLNVTGGSGGSGATVFDGNVASNDFTEGKDGHQVHDIANGGAILLLRASGTATLTEVFFRNNTAENVGGAIFAEATSAEITSAIGKHLVRLTLDRSEASSDNRDRTGTIVASGAPFDMGCLPGQYHSKQDTTGALFFAAVLFASWKLNLDLVCVLVLKCNIIYFSSFFNLNCLSSIPFFNSSHRSLSRL